MNWQLLVCSGSIATNDGAMKSSGVRSEKLSSYDDR